MGVRDETGIHDEASRDPGVLLRTVPLPIHQVLYPTSTAAGVKEAPDSVHWTGARGLSWTCLTLETWNVGWIIMDLGSRRRTASVLLTRVMGKGPTNLGGSLQLSNLRGRSRVESQTFWPVW